MPVAAAKAELDWLAAPALELEPEPLPAVPVVWVPWVGRAGPVGMELPLVLAKVIPPKTHGQFLVRSTAQTALHLPASLRVWRAPLKTDARYVSSALRLEPRAPVAVAATLLRLIRAESAELRSEVGLAFSSEARRDE